MMIEDILKRPSIRVFCAKGTECQEQMKQIAAMTSGVGKIPTNTLELKLFFNCEKCGNGTKVVLILPNDIAMELYKGKKKQ